jgi:hypothetical protein
VEDGFQFVKDLERRDEFSDVTASDVSLVQGASGRGVEAEFRVTMRYLTPTVARTPSGAVVEAGAPAARPTPVAAAAAGTEAPPPAGLEGVPESESPTEGEGEGEEQPPADEMEPPQ